MPLRGTTEAAGLGKGGSRPRRRTPHPSPAHTPQTPSLIPPGPAHINSRLAPTKCRPAHSGQGPAPGSAAAVVRAHWQPWGGAACAALARAAAVFARCLPGAPSFLAARPSWRRVCGERGRAGGAGAAAGAAAGFWPLPSIPLCSRYRPSRARQQHGGRQEDGEWERGRAGRTWWRSGRAAPWVRGGTLAWPGLGAGGAGEPLGTAHRGPQSSDRALLPLTAPLGRLPLRSVSSGPSRAMSRGLAELLRWLQEGRDGAEGVLVRVEFRFCLSCRVLACLLQWLWQIWVSWSEVVISSVRCA